MSPCGMNLAIRICFVTTLSSAFHLKADWFAQPWQLLSDFIPEFSTTTKKNLPKLSSCYLLRSSSCCLQSPHDDIKCESDADVRGWSPHGFFWLDSYGANIIRQIGFWFFFPHASTNYVENYSPDLSQNLSALPWCSPNVMNQLG